MDNDLNLSRTSLPENDNLIEDLVNEDPNLSGLIDLEVFNKYFNLSFKSVENHKKKGKLNIESDIDDGDDYVELPQPKKRGRPKSSANISANDLKGDYKGKNQKTNLMLKVIRVKLQKVKWLKIRRKTN